MNSRVRLFCSDYFFHYLLMNYPRIRLCIARWLSGDDDIQEVTIVNSEMYPKTKNGHKYILDITMRDDKGRYYNVEMQNSYISSSTLARFQIYTLGLIDMQLQNGLEYEQIQKVRQLVINTGTPITNFDQLHHHVELRDGDTGNQLKNGLVEMNFFQLRRWEDGKVEVQLRNDENMLHFMKLFLNEEEHDKPQTNEIAEETVGAYHKYLSSEQKLLMYKEMERDRLAILAEKADARAEGKAQGLAEGREEGLAEGRTLGKEEGVEEGIMQTIKTLILNKYGSQDISWLFDCNYEQLNQLLSLIVHEISYQELKEKVTNHK